MSVTLPIIHRTEIDGISAFWASSPGPFTGSVSFRVGMVDEPLPVAGISHFGEHLALHQLEDQAHGANGSVEDTRTTFTAAGSRAEVETFLTHVIARLGDLPLERMEKERDVLHDEAERRSPSARDALRCAGIAMGTAVSAPSPPIS